MDLSRDINHGVGSTKGLTNEGNVCLNTILNFLKQVFNLKPMRNRWFLCEGEGEY